MTGLEGPGKDKQSHERGGGSTVVHKEKENTTTFPGNDTIESILSFRNIKCLTSLIFVFFVLFPNKTGQKLY